MLKDVILFIIKKLKGNLVVLLVIQVNFTGRLIYWPRINV